MSWLGLALGIVLAHAGEPEPPEAPAEALDAQVVELYRAGQYAKAEPFARQALDVRERALGPNHPEVAQSLNNLAVVLNAMHDSVGALPLYRRSLAINEATFGPDHPEVALSLNNLAMMLSKQGDYGAARSLFERSLAIDEKALGPTHPDVASDLNNLAGVLQRQLDYTTALPLLERALAIREEALGPNHFLVAEGLNNLAFVYRELGDHVSALPLFERSLAINEVALGERHPKVAEGLQNVAALFEERGKFSEARPLYERGLAIAEAAHGPDHPSVARSLTQLARLLSLQGDYTDARSRFERALTIEEAAYGPDHLEVGGTLVGLALMLEEQGDHAAAKARYDRGIAIQEAVLGPDHPSLASSFNNFAKLLYAQGDYAGAQPLMERSLAVREATLGPRHPVVAGALSNLAAVLRARGDYAGAILLYERALAIEEEAFSTEHPNIARTLNNLAVALRWQGDDAGARPLHQRCLSIREARFDILDTLSEREALAYIRESRQYFDIWLAAFDEPGDSAEAWSTALRWKGVVTRAIRERQTAALLEDPEARELHRRLRSTRVALASAMFADFDTENATAHGERQLDLTREKEEIERQLAKISVSWRGHRVAEQSTGDEICAALPDGTGLVDFLRYNGRYLAFAVVAPECEVRRVELGDANQLDESVKEWRALLADPGQSTARVDNRGVHVRERVWDQLASTVEGANRLLVVPDAALSALPFGALPLAGHRYLLEELPIDYLEDARDLLRVPADRDVGGALLVGDVDFGGARQEPATIAMASFDPSRSAPCVSGDYERLMGTAEEVDAVGNLWAKGGHRREAAEILTGEFASEAAVYHQMSGKRIVHLATHGFFADERCRSALAGAGDERQSAVGHNPMLLSGIVLAGANAEHGVQDDYDGILTAEELSSIDLHGTELVVLSACETGLGVVSAGEGVLGLRRAFAAAGVGHLVMSLWSVPDVATSELMKGFYDRVLRRRKPKAPGDAMREVQLEMLQRNREEYGDGHPSTWAAFVVAGRPRQDTVDGD